MQKDIESRSLPPIDVLRFDGEPSKWPEFIDNFKTRVHMKVTFNDSMRMERLHSVLDGDAKKAVSSIGTNSTFYAAALKTLKREFGRPIVVANLKLKALFDHPQIHSRDRVALRNYHQQLKCSTTWFTSMDYQSAICSTENLTKAVKRLPEILRKSFYKATKDASFVSGDVTLIGFERWLDNRLTEYFNPIANIIAKQEVCWLCNQPHRLMECEKFIKKNLQDRKEFVSTNKLCWNCLSKAHFVRQCKSKYRCKIDKCGKRYHSLPHYPNHQTKNIHKKTKVEHYQY